MVGVNGAGKTTTIGKLAAAWKAEGRSVLVCAADTFRAAAAEQLEVWARAGRRALPPRGGGGRPLAPCSPTRCAWRAARGLDAVLVDTAGRLHTKTNLMAELAQDGARGRARGRRARPTSRCSSSTRRSASNGLAQGREFAKAAGVTGLVLTKLDGTAKGGVAVAVVRELGVPIRYVGVGETIEDLLPFEAGAFAESLVG